MLAEACISSFLERSFDRTRRYHGASVSRPEEVVSPFKLFDNLTNGDRSAALRALLLVVKRLAKVFFRASRVTRPDLGT